MGSSTCLLVRGVCGYIQAKLIQDNIFRPFSHSTKSTYLHFRVNFGKKRARSRLILLVENRLLLPFGWPHLNSRKTSNPLASDQSVRCLVSNANFYYELTQKAETRRKLRLAELLEIHSNTTPECETVSKRSPT